jgi:psp operon transcriptional activator
MAAELEWESVPSFSDDAMDRLVSHAWRGNVRELRNVVERTVYRCWTPDHPIDDVVFDPFVSPYRPAQRREHEPSGERNPEHDPERAFQALDLDAALARFEADLLGRALAAARHNQREAARSLGLAYHQFRNRLKKHAIGRPSSVADQDLRQPRDIAEAGQN